MTPYILHIISTDLQIMVSYAFKTSLQTLLLNAVVRCHHLINVLKQRKSFRTIWHVRTELNASVYHSTLQNTATFIRDGCYSVISWYITFQPSGEWCFHKSLF